MTVSWVPGTSQRPYCGKIAVGECSCIRDITLFDVSLCASSFYELVDDVSFYSLIPCSFYFYVVLHWVQIWVLSLRHNTFSRRRYAAFFYGKRTDRFTLLVCDLFPLFALLLRCFFRTVFRTVFRLLALFLRTPDPSWSLSCRLPATSPMISRPVFFSVCLLASAKDDPLES